MARRILAAAPPRFALAGLSMGGYVAFEIMRQARRLRGRKLALLDTRRAWRGAGAVRAAQAAHRAGQERTLRRNFDPQYPTLVHHSRHGDAALKATVRAMNEETGADAYLRQQQAIMTRVDSRPSLAAIRCPTLVLVGDSDEATPPDLAREMATAIAERNSSSFRSVDICPQWSGPKR